MVIIPATTALDNSMAVPLPLYAQTIGVDECAFWGVNTGNQQSGCSAIWQLDERQLVARYLAEAQEEIERVTGYPLQPTWFTAEIHYTNPAMLRHSKVNAMGVRATAVIASGTAVDHTADPAIVGPIATSVTSSAEIVIYHPGTTVEITPSEITIAGGMVTIAVPRCRMVTIALSDNDMQGLDYTDLNNFEATVDVARVYTDTTQPGVWVRAACTHTCTETTSTLCARIQDGPLGLIVADTVQCSGLCGCNAHFMRLNYQAGMTALTKQMTDTVIRLAHTKMPYEPCGCERARSVWGRDRFVPEVITAERLACPFGASDGAWLAYRWAIAQRTVRAGVL
jgi:hypothetical protein